MTAQSVKAILANVFANATVKVVDEKGKEYAIKAIKQDIMRDVVIVVGD